MNSSLKSPMREIVINTGPVMALVAATGSLNWLAEWYRGEASVIHTATGQCIDTVAIDEKVNVRGCSHLGAQASSSARRMRKPTESRSNL